MTGMIDKSVQMMDAGMRLFETEKPFGTVLGGIKTEMAQYGKVSRANEMDMDALPAASVGCDIFLDRSTKYKSKYISCTLEDAGVVGKTPDGEEIHRYAATLKEGNRNTNTGLYFFLSLIMIWAMLGWFISKGSGLLTVVFMLTGVYGAYHNLRPSRDNARLAEQLLTAFEEAK